MTDDKVNRIVAYDAGTEQFVALRTDLDINRLPDRNEDPEDAYSLIDGLVNRIAALEQRLGLLEGHHHEYKGAGLPGLTPIGFAPTERTSAPFPKESML